MGMKLFLKRLFHFILEIKGNANTKWASCVFNPYSTFSSWNSWSFILKNKRQGNLP